MVRICADSPDEDLISGLQAGQNGALEILYDRYGRLVFTTALRILNHRDEAEDLTQEIFLFFWRRGRFQPERASLGTYLIVLTRSRALNKLRSRSAQQRSVERLQQWCDSELAQRSPLERATVQEQRQQLQQAIAQLPENQKQVLVLNYLHGLSHTKIAQRLGMPLGTVKTNAREGLRRLRRLLGEAVE